MTELKRNDYEPEVLHLKANISPPSAMAGNDFGCFPLLLCEGGWIMCYGHLFWIQKGEGMWCVCVCVCVCVRVCEHAGQPEGAL